ncbi:MAG: PP0621 family protein [Noviherbaspirillum sp.]
MKFLVWGVIVVLIVLWFMRPKALRSSGRKPSPAVGAPEAMLQCVECRTYFPASEAVTAADGAVFCCEQHRQLQATRQ